MRKYSKFSNEKSIYFIFKYNNNYFLCFRIFTNKNIKKIYTIQHLKIIAQDLRIKMNIL